MKIICGEIGYTPFEFYNLLPKEAGFVIEGYNNKLKRENEVLIFNAKVARKAAYITILPHVKGLSEKKFNMEIWSIDERKPTEEFKKEQIARMQKALKEHNLKLSEARRKKAENKLKPKG